MDLDDTGSFGDSFASASSYRLPIVSRDANIPTFADSTWSFAFPEEGDSLPTDHDKAWGNLAPYPLMEMGIYRHLKQVNIACLDGHAETTPLPQLWTYEWHPNWRQPANLPLLR